MIRIENTEVSGWEAEIPNHCGFRATRDGNIIGKRGRPMIGHVDRCGYHEVLLSENGKTKNYLVHRLIAKTFIKNPDNKPFVNHKDGNKLNNSIENLEWCTRSENTTHSYKNGLQSVVTNQYGTHHVLDSESLRIIRDARKLGCTTDKEVALIIGCSRELVGRKRREMCV